jgi:hypothetical protein
MCKKDNTKSKIEKLLVYFIIGAITLLAGTWQSNAQSLLQILAV